MDKKGFTLLEVIIAILFLSIVVLAAVPAFYAQFQIMNNTKDITTEAFDNQREMERAITNTRNQMIEQNTNINPTQEISLFDKKVVLTKVELQNENGVSISTYLSNSFTKGGVRIEPKAENVWIEISTDSLDKTADITLNPTLKGTYDIIEGESLFYLSLYNWYISKEGIINPQFPADYDLVSTGIFLNNINNYLNRYAVFTVTPVDAYGVRGRQVPSQKIYIRGESWEEGNFAWVDMNGNGKYDEGVDVIIPNHHLLGEFDTMGAIFDEDLNQINIAGGSLYIPKNVDIFIDNEHELNWTICKNVNIATDIHIDNGTDVSIITREGSINLFEFGGDGVNIQSQGSILLSTEGRGNINIQRNSRLISGQSLQITPKGRLNIWGAELKGEDMVLDTSQRTSITGNRSIEVEDSILQLHNTRLERGGNISIITPNNFYMPTGAIKDTGPIKGQLFLTVGGETTLPSNLTIEIPEDLMD